jgi:hypothetical protein
MSDTPRDDFFIGWLPVPASYRRVLLPVAVGLLVVAAGTAAALAYLQRDPGPAHWGSDTVTFDGILLTSPYALIRVPGEADGRARVLILVEEGKFGALARAEQLVHGRREGVAVRVSGTVLHRDGRWVLELAEGEKGLRRLTAEEERRLRPGLGWPEAEVVAERATLTGEIIDPKCYLGAMKPGGGKTHKACAMLCISGGVPPMFVTRDADRRETFYLLTTADGGPANEQVLPFVGDPTSVTGRVERRGDLLFLGLATNGVRRR